MKTLYLIRGAQGSGKSTLARLIEDGYKHRNTGGAGFAHLEADMFWYNIGMGEYKFDASRLGEAHAWCQSLCQESMLAGFELVVVSNTFIKRKDMKPYLEMADTYGYTVQEIICRGEFENTHGVPEDIVKRKRAELEL